MLQRAPRWSAKILSFPQFVFLLRISDSFPPFPEGSLNLFFLVKASPAHDPLAQHHHHGNPPCIFGGLEVPGWGWGSRGKPACWALTVDHRHSCGVSACWWQRTIPSLEVLCWLSTSKEKKKQPCGFLSCKCLLLMMVQLAVPSWDLWLTGHSKQLNPLSIVPLRALNFPHELHF